MPLQWNDFVSDNGLSLTYYIEEDMSRQTIIYLAPEFFEHREQLLVKTETLFASIFKYESGVPAVRLRNAQGELIMLPFQGQQIWSATFGGRNLTMKSMFTAPRAARDYLSNYGGFLLHCGATAMGVPSGEDKHPLHGELPNAEYQKAWLLIGEDEGGEYLALGGEYQHTIAFSTNYLAQPQVKLYAGANRCWITFTVTNLKRTPMELMYMAHVNFRPVDYGQLVYTAEATPENTSLRTSIPSHVRPSPAYVEFLQTLQRDPSQHNLLAPDLAFDPEVVLTQSYKTDSNGWAHAMQVHPDGSADYIRYKPAQLDKGVRWICRTPDQDALGLVLPATAEAEGYHAEKAKGHVKILPAGESFTCEIEAGWLSPTDAAAMTATIHTIMDRAPEPAPEIIPEIPPVKRGRGRPPKTLAAAMRTLEIAQPISTAPVASASATAEQPKRPRGRPRRAASVTAEAQATEQPKRRPGRPRRSEASAVATTTAEQPKRRPGRPRRNAANAAPATEQPKRPRGRPPRNAQITPTATEGIEQPNVVEEVLLMEEAVAETAVTEETTASIQLAVDSDVVNVEQAEALPPESDFEADVLATQSEPEPFAVEPTADPVEAVQMMEEVTPEVPSENHVENNAVDEPIELPKRKRGRPRKVQVS